MVIADNPDELDFEGVFQFDEDRYRRYTERFIKAPDTPHIPFWEIVLAEIQVPSR